jgi:hypothetical protein
MPFFIAESPHVAWLLQQLPSNCVRQFQIVYCMWIALAILRNLRSHTAFLTWFDGSGLKLSRKRGLGAHPSKLYGLFSPPTLTGTQFCVCGLALAGCLIASCAPMLPRVFLFLSYLLSLCYFPQLYAEVTASGHSTILIPSILFILACSSSLDHDIQSTSEWPLVLIRIYIASGYFSSGACKLLCGLRFNRYWGWGPTLQMYIFDSMWSRPASAPVRRLQQALLTMPWLLTLLATGSVAFETSFILAPTSDFLCLVFGLNGMLFHWSIAVLQVCASERASARRSLCARVLQLQLRGVHASCVLRERLVALTPPSFPSPCCWCVCACRRAYRASTSSPFGRPRSSPSSSGCRRVSRGRRCCADGRRRPASSYPR